LKATIPHLTRSPVPAKKKFKAYPIGYFHIDIAEVCMEEGRLYLLVAINRTSKFAFVKLHEKVTTGIASNFLRVLIKAVPYKVHAVLAHHGIHFRIGQRMSNSELMHIAP
jgi:hypothetical protein